MTLRPALLHAQGAVLNTTQFDASAQPLSRRFATLPRRAHTVFQASPLRPPGLKGGRCRADEFWRRQAPCCVVGARCVGQ